MDTKTPMKSSTQPKESSEESAEDETSPEAKVVKGMAYSGISYVKSTESAPKCLGQDMRLEKMIQITEHCEKETGEGTNSTESGGKALSLCFTACMWKYLRLIGADLMFTSEMDSMVIDLFPPVAHGMVMKAVRGCAKVTVLPLSKADNCASFGPLKSCILRNIQNICSGNY
ncbi:hypothetical protein Ocin01_12554 [Orchesella cincta]|uniref:Uncharacterized protein n=1 Tax=Orchesella cincta TaxID=48709 RepID=A0A1D2MM74_ORCCI|nr:hypothetical protein Ocin01_12554 [Orchesella cincta]